MKAIKFIVVLALIVLLVIGITLTLEPPAELTSSTWEEIGE